MGSAGDGTGRAQRGWRAPPTGLRDSPSPAIPLPDVPAAIGALNVRDGFVARPALVRRLRSGRGSALALIVAPAGYGESTRLAQWAQCEERPVGLYLAALSLREQGHEPAASTPFCASDHLVTEYFRDEFLADLSPEVLRFVTRTSVLDELSGPLCDAVLEDDGSARTLAEL